MSDNVAQVLKYLYERKLNSILDGNISWRNDYDEGFYIVALENHILKSIQHASPRFRQPEDQRDSFLKIHMPLMS